MGIDRVLAYAVLYWLVLSVALGAPQSAAASEGEGLSLLGPETVEVTGDQGDDSATGYLTLLNSSKASAPFSVSFQASSDEDLTAGKVTPGSIPPHTARRVPVVFSGLGSLDGQASGELIVESGESVLSKAVEVKPGPQPLTSSWPAALVGGSFVLALVLGLGVAIGTDNADLGRPAPGPKLTYESWGTTLTAAGAILATVLGEVTYPPFPVQIDKDSLVNLNLLFLALIVLAPFAYQALRRSDAGAVGEEEKMVGTNLTLLLACTLTLWAVLGELGTVTLLAWELISGAVPHFFLLIGSALVLILAIVYFLRTTNRMVRKAWAPAAPTSQGLPAPGVTEAVAPGEPREIDFREVDTLRLGATGFPVATLSRPEHGNVVELAVPSSTAATQPHWSLL
jgi:hypothetical protein